ncbi:hypothetical protein [Candidatus Mesenet endosymbiont of Agriotes lineatus]|uniref:hypothetical protein n=1 Tax=Candidatus Mesenet endosymbiont of Agriotes lineatus TaxID=3077948 RepID=UPI0030CCAAE3
MHYLKRIWQWLKNAISKVLAFFRSKVSTKNNISKSSNNTVHKQGNSIKEGIQNIIDGINPESTEEFKNFFTSPKTQVARGIWILLFDLLLDFYYNKKRPMIFVQGVNL